MGEVGEKASRSNGEGSGLLADDEVLEGLGEEVVPFFEGAGPVASYRIVECSSERRSNMRTEPSAPTEAKTSREEGDQATSYTSRSCAISWVTGTPVEMSQTVQVCQEALG